MSTFIEESEKNFLSNGSVDHINAGSLQRIAEATEMMARNYLDLLADVKSAKKKLLTEQKRNAAYRGIIKGLKGGKR